MLSKYGIAIALLIGVASCSKDKDVVTAPTINNLEIGTGNSKTGHPGNDIHIEGTVTAPGTIAGINVEIHPESGNGWQYTQNFTEGYAGAKNADFHEHIDIPGDAAPGNYQVHIRITDQAGNVTAIESELKIILDPALPSMSNLQVGYEGNDEVHIEGDIAAPNKIASIRIEVHGGNYEQLFDVTGDYAGQTTYKLHQHVHITGAPSGHYHVHIAVKDQAGKEVEFEGHFDK